MKKTTQLPWSWRGITASLLLLSTGFYQGLTYRRYALSTGKWPAGASLRFLVVSDLHNIRFGPEQEKILGLMREKRPDYLLFGGDMADEKRPLAAAETFFRGAADIAPGYYVTGNHEYRTGRVPAIRAMVRRQGVQVLSDRFVRLMSPAGPLILAGCEDPAAELVAGSRYRQDRSLQRAFGEISRESCYTVLLAHRPERIDLYRRFGFDLVVSGHSHGGQVRIPGLLNGLYCSGQGVFPRFAGGCYQHGPTTHIVGRGVAVYRSIPRLFNPPEIVVIDIRGTGRR